MIGKSVCCSLELYEQLRLFASTTPKKIKDESLIPLALRTRSGLIELIECSAEPPKSRRDWNLVDGGVDGVHVHTAVPSVEREFFDAISLQDGILNGRDVVSIISRVVDQLVAIEVSYFGQQGARRGNVARQEAAVAVGIGEDISIGVEHGFDSFVHGRRVAATVACDEDMAV